MMAIAGYRRIKISPKHEAKMLDVLLTTSDQFKAVSIDEYVITKSQRSLLTKKKIPYTRI